jgi:putative flippase GtrA
MKKLLEPIFKLIFRFIPERIFRFCVIGGSAAAVHWLVVLSVVSMTGMEPLIANIIAFLCAFSVSYVGHKNWTFEAREQAHGPAAVKFFTVAVTGFCINESVFAIMLKGLHIHYLIGSAVAIATAAVSTYILSQCWAFSPGKKEELS